MTTCRYPRTAIRRDYARAAAGLTLSAVPLIVAGSVPAVAVIFGLAAAIFMIFGFRAWKRSQLAITVDDKGISTSSPGHATLCWVDVVDIKLNYYTTRRDRTGGWMQLVLKGATGQVRAESTLDGFDAVVEGAAAAARRNGLVLGLATVSNFHALGVDLSETLEP